MCGLIKWLPSLFSFDAENEEGIDLDANNTKKKKKKGTGVQVRNHIG